MSFCEKEGGKIQERRWSTSVLTSSQVMPSRTQPRLASGPPLPFPPAAIHHSYSHQQPSAAIATVPSALQPFWPHFCSVVPSIVACNDAAAIVYPRAPPSEPLIYGMDNPNLGNYMWFKAQGMGLNFGYYYFIQVLGSSLLSHLLGFIDPLIDKELLTVLELAQCPLSRSIVKRFFPV